MAYVSNIRVAASNGSINKLFISGKVAAGDGPINKKIIAMKVAAGDGPINKTVLLGGLLGDVNGDGEISISDYTMVRMYLEQQGTLTPEQYNRADVDRDGVVTENDKNLIQAMILG